MVHYIRDAHQPLHISFADDKGGNSVKVQAYGDSTNLHAVWDSVLIKRQNGDWLAYADDLRGRIKPEDVATWQATLDPLAWANESLQITRDIYVELPAYRGELATWYTEQNLPIIERRLQMGGVRLAAVLNALLEDGQLPWDSSAYLGDDPGEQDTISICSFNIKWLGHYKKKNEAALADLVGKYDIVLVQEMVSPPVDGAYPNGHSYSADPEAEEFLLRMKELGYEWVLSSEDTGPGESNQNIGAATEWWIAFYKSGEVEVAEDLPQGWLADDRTQHPIYKRVPYAFAFRDKNGGVDFVLVSVHLAPGSRAVDRQTRASEMAAIDSWIQAQGIGERDYLVVGDMNIHSEEELATFLPDGYVSLNFECAATNTQPDKPKPYDHVVYLPNWVDEVDDGFGFQVLDLVKAMESSWEGDGDYPGNPYSGSLFSQVYSDHQPVVFQLEVPEMDDD